MAVGYYELALSLGPGEMAWGAVLAAAAGAGFGSMLLFAGLLAALAGLVRVLAARRGVGPGKAGGTGHSDARSLQLRRTRFAGRHGVERSCGDEARTLGERRRPPMQWP